MGNVIACVGTLALAVVLYVSVIYGAAYIDDIIKNKNKK